MLDTRHVVDHQKAVLSSFLSQSLSSLKFIPPWRRFCEFIIPSEIFQWKNIFLWLLGRIAGTEEDYLLYEPVSPGTLVLYSFMSFRGKCQAQKSLTTLLAQALQYQVMGKMSIILIPVLLFLYEEPTKYNKLLDYKRWWWFTNWAKRISFKYFSNNLDLYVKIICPNQNRFFTESEY